MMTMAMAILLLMTMFDSLVAAAAAVAASALMVVASMLRGLQKITQRKIKKFIWKRKISRTFTR
jgi:hypothetical protein